MKAKVALISLFLVTMSTACTKPGLDLAELPLPTDPKPIFAKYANKLYMELADFSVYRSKDKRLMWYGGEALSGSMVDNKDKENGFFAANYASFYVDRSSQQISAYEIHTKTEDKTKQLEAALHQQFGKPDYFYRDADFSSRVWERDNKFHLLATNSTIVVLGEKTRTADLMVIAAENSQLLNWFSSGGGFSYYGDYLYERNKPERQGKHYRYADFFRDEEAEAKSWGQEHSRYFDDYVQD